MSRLTKAEQEKIDNEIVPLEIPRRIAERIKFLAQYEKRSVADFLDLVIENSDDMYLWDKVIVKIFQAPPGVVPNATIRGNPDILMTWMKFQIQKFTEDPKE